MKRAIVFSLMMVCATAISAIAQQSLLQSGPMLANVDMLAADIWVQTKEPAKVQLRYFRSDSAKESGISQVYTTDAKLANTAIITLENLKPGKTYQYELLINGKPCKFSYPTKLKTQTLWQYRTDPPAMKIALGSCFYNPEPMSDRPGKPYGDKLGIFETIHKEKPELMLWLGDNTYLREPDFGHRSSIFRRYTLSRSLPQLQPLLASTAHFGIWDDHDYGPNDGDRGFVNKNYTYEAFRTFWPNNNANATSAGGITTTFTYGDAQFFLMDDRWFRTSVSDPTNRPKVMLGEAQLNWLLDNLISSKATFKFICIGSQVLNTAPVHENYANYPEELLKLKEVIAQSKAKGVMFFSGDRHFTELSKLERSGTYPLYDLTVSPLTSGTASPSKNENNHNRVEGTLVTGERNFCLMEITGPKDDRVLKFKIITDEGKLMWQRDIAAKELK